MERSEVGFEGWWWLYYLISRLRSARHQILEEREDTVALDWNIRDLVILYFRYQIS